MVMEHGSRIYAAVFATAAIFIGNTACAQSSSLVAARSESKMMQHAKGTFEVKVIPQENKTGDDTLGHLLLEKQLHGDLQGTSRGQMLSAQNAEPGSAGYVAIERVTGTLHGRSGSFVLQHVGHMGRNQMQITVSVLPDSGTGELQGLNGTLRIIVAAGKHSYEFDYSLER